MSDNQKSSEVREVSRFDEARVRIGMCNFLSGYNSILREVHAVKIEALLHYLETTEWRESTYYDDFVKLMQFFPHPSEIPMVVNAFHNLACDPAISQKSFDELIELIR